MSYGKIEKNWFSSAPRQTVAAGMENGQRYAGFLIPSKMRRLACAAVMYLPSLVGLVMLQNLAHDHRTLGLLGLPLAFSRLMLIVAVYGWSLLAVPQHEGQNRRKWAKTQVVQFRDVDGAMMPCWPTTPRLLLRALLVLFIDAPFGWLSMAMSKGNRSFSDRICGTVVIMAGQVTPMPPNPARPRRDWLADDTVRHAWHVMSGATSKQQEAVR